MKTSEIIALKQQGYGRDAIYQIAAGNLGLFGIAFFGHKGKPADKAKLNRTWNRIVSNFN